MHQTDCSLGLLLPVGQTRRLPRAISASMQPLQRLLVARSMPAERKLGALMVLSAA
jgi:hypothetical protein